MAEAGREAACVLAHLARLQGNGAELMKYALRDMLDTPCAEICYELGCYYKDSMDYDEAIVWYQNAVSETECILDVEAGGKKSLFGCLLRGFACADGKSRITDIIGTAKAVHRNI